MTYQGRPVFDGPATNALAHLVHSIMYLESPQPNGFSIPAEVRGELYRARNIESYDIASLRGEFSSGSDFSITLTHASQQELPFRLFISGTKGWARISLDGGLVETSFSTPFQPAEPEEILRNSYRAFSDFVEGKLERPPTTLEDCRGYTIATNGMLLSSNGVHQIPSRSIEIYGASGNRGYHVPGLTDAAAQSLDQGMSLSDLRVPWAVPTHPVSRAVIENADLMPYLESRHLAPARVAH
jgi:hypothetical protein